MIGTLVTYSSPTKLVSTQAYYKLIGRISVRNNSRGKRYVYLKGLLHNTKFIILGRGCVFFEGREDLDYSHITVKTYDAEIEISEDDMMTPQEYYLSKYKKVVGLGEN